jgi:hypothetical protein
MTNYRKILALAFVFTIGIFPSRGVSSKPFEFSRCLSVLGSEYVELEIGHHFVSGTIAKTAPLGYSFDLKVTALRPIDGIGHLLVIKFREFDGLTRQAVETWPGFFQKYDMYADSKTLVIPDAIRLNYLNPQAIQFRNVPFFLPQYYSENFFKRSLKKGLIPLASWGDAFLHDRTQEHLLGALIMPKWMYQMFQTYLQFEAEWLNLATVKKSRETRQVIERFLSVGLMWDVVTANLGHFFSFSVDPRRKVAEELQIEYLTEVLYKQSAILRPGFSDRAKTLSVQFQLGNLEQLDAETERLGQKFHYVPVTREFARKEAERIVAELSVKSSDPLK